MVDCHVPLRVVQLGPSRLALVGELDMSEVPEVEAHLAKLTGDVIIDCSGLTFVDASGLGLFVRARQACETRGMRFALSEPSDCLLKLLSITGLDSTLLLEVDAPGA